MYDIQCLRLTCFQGQGEIDFDDFCVLMQRMTGDGGDTDEYDETRETFKAFDKSGNDKITISDLKSVLESLTVKLTSDELNGILEEMRSVGSELNYSGMSHLQFECTLFFSTRNQFKSNQASDILKSKKF